MSKNSINIDVVIYFLLITILSLHAFAIDSKARHPSAIIIAVLIAVIYALGISQLVMILLAIGTTTTIYIVHQLSITTNIMNRSIIYCIKASPILELFNSRFFF